MSIYKSAIQKPVTTLLIFVAVVVIGLYSLSRLPIDQFPEIDPPYVTVMTTYSGANASEVETNVTRLLENGLNSVDGLKEITSTSSDNVSMISMEFEWETNLDEVINDVRSSIDMIRDNLPSGCSTPFIFKISSSSIPIAMYAVTANESYAGLDKILNDDVVPQLNRVDGIGNISIMGSPERYIYVDLDQQKLDAYKLPLEIVGNAIGNNNLNLASGVVKMDKEQYQVQVRSEYIESSEINDIVVSTTVEGKQIFVRDIATVRDTIKDLSLDEKINGKDGVRLVITKATGGNTVRILEDLNKELKRIGNELPPDIKFDVIYDSSEDIQNSVNSLAESIMWALLFVVIVVLFFLGRWRATLIIGFTIPIALIVSFIYLAFTGSSLNIISLSSLTIAIGMVVDDAIVVLENITRHVERGSSPREAAKYGTNEVWVSVIATTLVIVVVFMPLTMLTGMAGILFKELGWIVTLVVVTSTIIAITLTPMLSSKLLKSKKIKVDDKGHLIEETDKKSWYDRHIVKFLDKVDEFYSNSLRFCLKNKLVTLLFALGIFGASLIPLFSGMIGTDFMQTTDNGRLEVTVELNQGTRIEETLKTARRLEQRFMEIAPEIRIISTSAGLNEEAGISALFSSSTNSKISMILVANKKQERERSIDEIAEVLRQEMALYPEITDYQAMASSSGMTGASTVDVEIYGYDFDKTYLLAENIRQAITDSVPGARNITISREEDRPELKVVVDKEKLALHSLNSATVATYVRNRINGMQTGYLKEDGDEYDIVVRMKEQNRNSLTELENMSIPTATGGIIKLKEVAKIEEHWSPQDIERKNRQRVVKVSSLPYKISLGELAEDIDGVVKSIDVPDNINIRLGGTYEDQQETFGDIILLGLMIVLLVYIVMASQFESYSKPFIIMMAIPFAFTGVILSLLITGTTLDMIGALGIIMLVGIVVKNGIVLVDYINLMRDRGYELNEAIALSGKSRLRPVLMTAFTTILGMVPMTLSQGTGSEMWRPMGIVIIGGLIASTLVTLIVVPILYSVMSRHGERDKEKGQRSKYVFMQLADNDEQE